MDKKHLIGISICAVVLLVLGSLSNVVGRQTVQSSHKTTITNGVTCGFKQDDIINWTVNGTMGNNGWYISPIILTCSYNHSIIAEVYYRYSGNGGWVLYTEPFTISSQGMIVFEWYWVDYDGGEHQTIPTIFGIDYTPPYLTVTTIRIGVFTWRITVDACDNDSGIDYAEFYIDDVLQITIERPPYVWIWTQNIFEKPVIKVVVYDGAGWNASYSKTTSTEYYNSHHNNQHRSLLYSALMMYSQMRIELRDDYR